MRSLPQGSEWECIRNHAWTDVFGSCPCGNESLPHRNDLLPHRNDSSKQFGISGVQRCAILSHDIESLSHDIGSLSHDIGSLSHDNKPFPHGFDSFPYRFNGTTIGFRPSTIAFVLDPSDSKSLRYNSALDSCALAADSSLFTPGRHRSGAGKTVHEAWTVTASKQLRVHMFFRRNVTNRGGPVFCQ